MTLRLSASSEIAATPQEVLEFVLDLDRYRRVDDKIMRVSSITGPDEHGHGSVRLWGKLPGMLPAPDRQDFSLERWTRLTFVGADRQPGRLVFDFVGTFDCEPTNSGTTTVTHAYEFDFRRPFRWLERRMAGPLDQAINDEVARLAGLISRPPSSSTHSER